MKITFLLYVATILTVAAANASPILSVGTPANSLLSVPTGPTPKLGGLFINFDNLTPCTSSPCPSLPSTTYALQGVSSISSPDGLIVIPYSTQSSPNGLFDNSSNGTANISIKLAQGTSAIGIGIADSDPVSITLQALDANGNPFGSQFSVNLATTESQINTGNGYYVISDTSSDLFGLRILQSTASASYSGLAIDDLQAAVPEPATFSLILVAALAGGIRLRKRV